MPMRTVESIKAEEISRSLVKVSFSKVAIKSLYQKKHSLGKRRFATASLLGKILHMRDLIPALYFRINPLSDSGTPPWSETKRSTVMCKSYFSRSSAIVFIIGLA